MTAGDLVRALTGPGDAIGDPLAVLLLTITIPYVWAQRAAFRTGQVTRTGALILTATASVWAARTGQLHLSLLALTTGLAFTLTTPSRRHQTEPAP